MGRQRVPHDTVFIGQPLWASIGFTLPALLGAAMAAPGRRPVLLIGDGAARLTIGELGTLIRYRVPALDVPSPDETGPGFVDHSPAPQQRDVRQPNGVQQPVQVAFCSRPVDEHVGKHRGRYRQQGLGGAHETLQGIGIRDRSRDHERCSRSVDRQFGDVRR